eukprot:c20914_g1_i1.p1 GENE.c20914_g1_i1~~c20914_g1_i1.p1  ORF type:complete len:877 (+),score=314.47 c20914_g1_i1:67-2697(+)
MGPKKMFPEDMDFADKNIELLPNKSEMNEQERVATAAACVIHALEGLPPTYCPAGRFKVFMLLHNDYYRVVLKLIVLFSIALAGFEAPPQLYGASSEELVEAGFWATWKAITANAFICSFFTIHCLLTIYLRGWSALYRTHTMYLFIVVILLDIDFFVAVATGGIHPFRLFRPLVYTFTSVQQTMMIKCCLYTLKPLLKTFCLLFVAIGFYAIVGLNLFSGHVKNDEDKNGNQFGAACLIQAGEAHPFNNFGDSIVTMYVLATSDNHPYILYPFTTCSCQFTPADESGETYTWRTKTFCTRRKYVSIAFVVSYVAIVFFCVGNSILAVCYFWFERVMKQNVVRTGLEQRFSLITAFYYLESNGSLSKDTFLKCTDLMRTISPALPGSVESDALFFHFLDLTSNGSLNLSEFFKICDLMRVNVTFRKSKFRFSTYESWRSSSLQKILLKIVNYKILGIGALDATVSLIVLVNAILASLESTRSTFQNVYADATTWVFVLEVLIKVGANGAVAYWIDVWNRFDFYVTVLSVLVFIVTFGLSTDHPLFGVVQCIRLLRLIKLLTLLQRASSKTNGLDSKEEGFYKQLLDSLTTTIPVCVNVLLMLFFFLYFFAVIGLELFYTTNATVRILGVGDGTANYVYNEQYQFDWADLGSALFSVFIISVRNTWSSVMYAAQAQNRSYGTFLFFIGMHFCLVFLLLNIIQSLFVFTFSTLMSENAFKTTIEYQIRQEITKLYNVSTKSFKRLYRTPRLEFLLLSFEELRDEYEEWVKSTTSNEKNLMGLGSKCLPIKGVGSFLIGSDIEEKPGKTYIRKMASFLANEIGVKCEHTHLVDELIPFQEDEQLLQPKLSVESEQAAEFSASESKKNGKDSKEKRSSGK